MDQVKRALAVGAVVAMLAVAGCSKSNSSSEDARTSSTTEQTTTTTEATYTTAQLQSKLLSVADLPPGWSVDNAANEGTSSVPSCFQQLEDVGTDEASEEVEISFQGSSEGIPSLMESIGPMTSAEFHDGVDILNGCTDVSFDVDGVPVTGTIGELSIEGVGDESGAWRMTFEIEGIPLAFEFSATRVGSLGVLVAVADLGGVEDGLLDAMTAKAVAKIRAEA